MIPSPFDRFRSGFAVVDRLRAGCEGPGVEHRELLTPA